MHLRRSPLAVLWPSLVLSLLLAPSSVLSQSSGLPHWSASAGDNILTVGADGIHIDQKEPKDTARFAQATRHLSLPAGKPWRVSFEARFGQLRSAGTAVALFTGQTRLGWIGADGWHKGLGCFVGTGFFHDPGQDAFPAPDTAWHRFEFVGAGGTLTIREDGGEVAAGPSGGTPDAINVGQFHAVLGGTPPAGQQTELWLRNVTAETVTPEQVAAMHPISTPAPSTQALGTGGAVLPARVTDTIQAIKSGAVSLKVTRCERQPRLYARNLNNCTWFVDVDITNRSGKSIFLPNMADLGYNDFTSGQLMAYDPETSHLDEYGVFWWNAVKKDSLAPGERVTVQFCVEGIGDALYLRQPTRLGFTLNGWSEISMRLSP